MEKITGFKSLVVVLGLLCAGIALEGAERIGRPEIISRTIIGLAIFALLCSPSLAVPSVFTVGPGGTYSTPQAGLDAAADTAGEHLIKVRAGTFIESIDRHTSMVADRVTISGGWNVWFMSRNTSPDATSIIATSQHRVATIALYYGEIVMDGLTFTGGDPSGSEVGGGVKVDLDYDTSFIMRNCRIINYQVDGLLPLRGGIYLDASGTSHVEITDCMISGNSVISSGEASGAGSAGIALNAFGQASVLMSRLKVEYNEGWMYSISAYDCGIRLWADDSATVTLEDSVFANNSINGTGIVNDACITIHAHLLSHVVVGRVAILDTENNTSASPDNVTINANDSAVVEVVDSIIGPSTSTDYGLAVYSEALATVNATNLTITGNQGSAYHGVADGPNQRLYNSIIYDNGSDSLVIDPGVATGGNLVATDPLFVDAANRNFQIRPGSPAIDSGNNSPPGGLSLLDFNRMARVHDGTVDAGAHEWGNLFADDFEYGSTGHWDAAVGE